MADLLDRITVDPSNFGGKPIVRGLTQLQAEGGNVGA
jgi:uncharacterized protein (DUF433 family)